MWSNSIRTAVFAAALIEYLTSRTLLTLHRAAETIGSKVLSYFHQKISHFTTAWVSQRGVERSHSPARRRLPSCPNQSS